MDRSWSRTFLKGRKSGLGWRLILNWPCLRHKSKVFKGSRTRGYGGIIRMRSKMFPQSIHGTEMIPSLFRLKLRCIMGPVVLLLSQSTKVKKASIWPIAEPACGVMQTTSLRMLRTAISMHLLKQETEQSKCSVPKFWLVFPVSKVLTELYWDLQSCQILILLLTASRVRQKAQMSSWFTPTGRPILSIWLLTCD